MQLLKRCTVVAAMVLCSLFLAGQLSAQEKIGVLFIQHGGFSEYSEQNLWDASAHIFAVRPDHIVHWMALWNPGWWNLILASGNGPKELGKYRFEYERIGGIDPFPSIIDSQLDQLEAVLTDRSVGGTEFIVDYTGWISPDRIEQFPYPRFLYTPPSYASGNSNLTYCGESEQGDGLVLDFTGGSVIGGGDAFTVGETITGGTSGATAVVAAVRIDSGSWAGFDAAGTIELSGVSGSFTDTELFSASGGGWARAEGTTHWDGCDPERYNVDGPAERFIGAGVDRIIAIDLTTSGVRFFKTYDALEMIKKALTDLGRSDIQIDWVNDPNNLMIKSRPTAPLGNWGTWTPDKGVPTDDPSVPLAENPNPIAEDLVLAELLVEGTEASFNGAVSDNATGVLILNHATRDYSQYHDPKIDDTLVLNRNIKNMFLTRHPTMDPDNIVGAYMGIKEDGTVEGYVGEERTRNMRGENLGHAWLYESGMDNSTGTPVYNGHGDLPGDEWGYKYWDALEYLKNRGVEHIVVCFPQIVADSVLNMVEIPNQIAKEIGYKNWIKWGLWDYSSYPGVGHPFADYWGIWVDTQCDDGAGGTKDCCFDMGGCPDNGTYADNGTYPPLRQTSGARDDLDPSLAYDVSEYGHLGYNPASGAPDPNAPVQNQYTGTWAMYQPPNDDSRLVEMLADHILLTAGMPDIYGKVSGDVSANVSVALYQLVCGAPNPVEATTTDANGKYLFDGLGNGTYLVMPEDENYDFTPLQVWVTVPRENSPSHDFTAMAK